MVTLILWLLFGGVVGWLASLLMTRYGTLGTLGNIVVGIAGAAVGGFLFQRQVVPSVFSLGSLVTAFIGAVILLALANLITRGSPAPR